MNNGSYKNELQKITKDKIHLSNIIKKCTEAPLTKKIRDLNIKTSSTH
mgnify:CR=1 FL=1